MLLPSSWWKVKPKDVGDESGGGLVPAAYVEPVRMSQGANSISWLMAK